MKTNIAEITVSEAYAIIVRMFPNCDVRVHSTVMLTATGPLLIWYCSVDKIVATMCTCCGADKTTETEFSVVQAYSWGELFALAEAKAEEIEDEKIQLI